MTEKRTVSPETRAKISRGNLGKKLPQRTEQHRAKLAEAARRRVGMKYRPRTRRNIMTPEGLANLRGRHVPMTDETKAKISAANLGKKRSAETRAKMSASHQGKPKTPEHVAAIRAAKRRNRQAQDGNPVRVITEPGTSPPGVTPVDPDRVGHGHNPGG